MKIIAFDLEACNRYVPGSIFSIGIVEANDIFNITSKYTLLINPETKFVTKFRKPIEFDIDEKALKNEPNFESIYPNIVELFSQDALYLAHSISNDLRMINYACKRYRLPSLKFKYICSQMLYSIFSDTSDGIGLSDAATLINSEFHHHYAEDDALMSLKLVEYICRIKGVSLIELLEEYNVSYGELKDYNILPMRSEMLDNQRDRRKKAREEDKKKKIEDNGDQIAIDINI